MPSAFGWFELSSCANWFRKSVNARCSWSESSDGKFIGERLSIAEVPKEKERQSVQKTKKNRQ
jgi:hypothetical protein